MTVAYEFMMKTHLFLRTNNYNLDVLWDAAPDRSEWIERIQRQRRSAANAFGDH